MKGATMKTQLSAVLFALCVSACGGGQESTNSPTILSYVRQVPRPETLAPEAQPVDVAAMKPGVGVKVEPVVDPHPIPTKYEDALAEGRKLAEQGDRVHAREMFEAAVKLDKRHAEPHMELARLHIGSGDKALAVSEAKKATKLAPNSSSAWNTMGRAELNRFAYDAAIDAFTKSVELNRDNVWAWNNLGYAELLLKKYDEAVEHLTEATSRQGATGYMWNNLGTALEQLDRLDDARNAFEEGGKLGSKEALASRTRLEGVKSIEFAKMEKDNKVEVKPGYELNEGQTDEDRAAGSGTGTGIGSDTETH
jgi:tetratricopeptide (TPR) repeat protein